jgi:hypothetical protein
MNVKINRLTLTDFMGMRRFVLEPKGQNVSIFGDNATGKTTFFTAFAWLLSDKDSKGAADFDIKPLDLSGKSVGGLESSVEAVLDVDGETLTLKKTYAEKFTKKRGSAEAVFTGHDIGYTVMGVPVKKSEFEDRIEEIAPKAIFSLLSSPTFFNEHLHWQKRREILLDVCGDISDADIIASDPALSELEAVLNGRKLDDHRKVLASRKAEINKTLATIPARINENQIGITGSGDVDAKKIKLEVAYLENSRSGLSEQLATLASGGAIAEKTKELREIESGLIALQNKEARRLDEALAGKRQDLNRMKFGLGAVEADTRKLSATIAENSAQIGSNLKRMDMLRAEWIACDAARFEGEETCPTCGQALPGDMVQLARDNFNANKATRLAEIAAEGKRLKELCATLEAQNAAHQGALADKQAGADKLTAEIEALEAEIHTPPDTTGATRERDKLLQQQHNLTEEISAVKENRQGAIDEIKEQIAHVEHEIAEHNRILAQVEHAKKAQERIAELKNQERALAAEYEAAEKELFLCDLFIKTKVALLSEKINSHFRIARFRLFEQNINGGIEPCCRTLAGGVPYESINSAARIQVGAEIVSVLQRHYAISMPVFFDNRESVTSLPEMHCQVISLIVSEKDPTLRIEMENANEQRHAA